MANISLFPVQNTLSFPQIKTLETYHEKRVYNDGDCF